MILINYRIALISIAFFAFNYWVLAAISRAELLSNVTKVSNAISKQLQVLQESLGAIRDVLLNGSQEFYLDAYRNPDHTRWSLQAKNAFLGTFPRYTLESAGMIFIGLLGAILVTTNRSGLDIVPVIGAFALGARIYSVSQQIYSGWATLKARGASMLSAGST